MQSGKTIFPFGDVKTKTSRFPTDAVKRACGPHSGDWATMTTEVTLEDGTIMPAMAIAHRRGPEVHTFLSTHGLTIAGKPQAHKDDDLDVDTGYVVARKCPMVLNDATQAQPSIDMTNKKRQYVLALEKRFRTESFPFRLFCTILGTCVVNAFYGWNYLNPERKLDWDEAMRRAFFSMMHNTVDELEHGLVDPDTLFKVPRNLRGWDRTDGDAAVGPKESEESDDSGEEGQSNLIHYAVPLSEVEGLSCGKQNKCVVCSMKVTFCCGPCSSRNPEVVFFPVHQRSSGKNCLLTYTPVIRGATRAQSQGAAPR